MATTTGAGTSTTWSRSSACRRRCCRGAVTGNYLDGMFPGIVPWREVHPFRFGLYVGVGTVLAIVVAALVGVVVMSPT
jgi:hypothetical protein